MTEAEVISEVLGLAIQREREAQQMYEDAAHAAVDIEARALLHELTEQERLHELRLMTVDPEVFRELGRRGAKVPDANDYLVVGEMRSGMTYEEVLTLAMAREKASFRLYTDLAAATDDPATAEMLRGLAQEEARHKMVLELAYDVRVAAAPRA